MSRCVCRKHGSSLHYHACRHVREACDSGGPLPDLDLPAADLVCSTCLSAEVRELLSCVSNLGWDEENFETHLEKWGRAWETLQSEIGYRPLCTDCLYEKTGLDLRRRPLSTHP